MRIKIKNKFYSLNDARFISKSMLVGVIICCASVAQAQTSTTSIKEKQIVENNKNLKNAIEENQRLTAKYQELETQMQQMQGQTDESSTKYDQLKRERDELAKQIENVRNSNRKYAQEINSLEDKVEDLQASHNELAAKAEMAEEANDRIKAASSQENVVPAVGKDANEVLERETKTIDLLSRIDAFNEQDEKLRNDAAKAHYNMGNIYFEKGEYEIAAREYYQAVTLMPNDPDAHYNLAIVSQDHLKDYKTAVEHFKMYLFLKPDAPDKNFINERLVQSQMALDSKIDSPLDKIK